PLDRSKLRGGHIESAKLGRGAFEIHAASESVLDRARLLENFFQHEMSELPPLGVLHPELQAADLHAGGIGAKIQNIEALAGDSRYVVIVEIYDLDGMLDDGV